jgi:hypothetical protein
VRCHVGPLVSFRNRQSHNQKSAQSLKANMLAQAYS